MDRSVCRKVGSSMYELDWTELPNDNVIRIFQRLNRREQASLASACKAWWIVSKSPVLWKELDLRPYKCDAEKIKSLASRCGNLRKLRFKGNESATYLVKLGATNVREIIAYGCHRLTDSALSAIAGRYEALECLHIYWDQNISTDAINSIAVCCPKLKKLWLTGVREVKREAILDLAHNCQSLTDIGLLHCQRVDVSALGDIKTLRFLSLAGTADIDWDSALLHWRKLLDLTCLDLSSTDVDPRAVSGFLSSGFKLQILCILNCPSIEIAAASINHGGKVLVAFFTDILKGLAKLFQSNENGNAFLDLRKADNTNDSKVIILDWLEYSICHSLILIRRTHTPSIDNFWHHQGTILLLSFLQSPHEEVQERAAKVVGSFVAPVYDYDDIDIERAEAFTRGGGIRLIINLACSSQERLRDKAIQAIVNLLVSDNVAKAVVDEGGVNVLITKARSTNIMVAERVMARLWNLCTDYDLKDAIVEDGAIRGLVEYVVKWSKTNAGGSVIAPAVGALASLAVDDKCCMEIASVGGIHVLAGLLKTGIHEHAQEQAINCLANMANNGIFSDAEHEKETVEALVQLALSPRAGVREELSRALRILSFPGRNREAVVAAGGVQALISLANNASHKLQEHVACALLGLADTAEYRITIAQEGGVTSLIALAKSPVKEVHENAAAALLIFSYHSENAIRIIQEDGVPALARLSSSSSSKMARFMSTIALTFIFDKGLDELAKVGTSDERTSKSNRLKNVRRMASKAIKAFLKSYSDPLALPLSTAASSSSATEVLTLERESAYFKEVDQIQCSELEIERLVNLLDHRSPDLKSCGAFALLQFTLPGGHNSLYHANLLQNDNALRTLQKVAKSSGSASQEAKGFVQIVLRNLEYHHRHVYNSN